MYKNRPYILTFTFIIFSILLIYLFLWPDIGRAIGSNESTLDKSATLTRIQKLSIPFILNQGQMDKRVKFYANTFGGTVFVTEKGEIIYSLPKVEQNEQALKQDTKALKGVEKVSEGWVLKEEFVCGRVKEVKAEEEAVTKVSYFIGSHSSTWRSNIPTYGLVSLGEVYQGIEVKVRAYGKNVEKSFLIERGGRPEDIVLRVEGGKGLKVNEKGELEIPTEIGVVKFTKPVAYQEIDEKKEYVQVSYTIKDENRYGFVVGSYDRNRPLVIDPLLASTFIGGSGWGESAYALAIDSSGNVYVAGWTSSRDYPTTLGAYDSNCWGQDVFVSKLDSQLSTLLASTFIGGGNVDGATALAIDSLGNIYVAGYTYSGDIYPLSTGYPTTPGAYDRSFNGNSDVFVSKLNSDLSQLLASTFIGGREDDETSALAIDSSGNVYVAGWTSSPTYPTTPGAYDIYHNGGRDVFVSKLNGDLSQLLASTFIGGSGIDIASTLAIDSLGNIYVAGDTSSSAYPTTPGAYDIYHNGGRDVFVSKLNGDLSQLLASTFIGGMFDDFAYALAIDPSGNIYVAGDTCSSDYPTTPGAYDTSSWAFDTPYACSNDFFVSKLNSDLSYLLASTFLGNFGTGEATGLAIDSSGNIYVAGWTSSSTYPTTPGAYDRSYNGNHDVFVSRLNSELSSLLASTFIGGNSIDEATALAIDSLGNIYVTGWTFSPTYPTTPDAYDTSH